LELSFSSAAYGVIACQVMNGCDKKNSGHSKHVLVVVYECLKLTVKPPHYIVWFKCSGTLLA